MVGVWGRVSQPERPGKYVCYPIYSAPDDFPISSAASSLNSRSPNSDADSDIPTAKPNQPNRMSEKSKNISNMLFHPERSMIAEFNVTTLHVADTSVHRTNALSTSLQPRCTRESSINKDDLSNPVPPIAANALNNRLGPMVGSRGLPAFASGQVKF